MNSTGSLIETRKAAVAGMFYPEQSEKLTKLVDTLLHSTTGLDKTPIALIAPHAGYIYSGPIAANAYSPFLRRPGGIHRVLLMGPSHRFSFEGVALPTSHYFQTPLGSLAVDRDAVEMLSLQEGVIFSDEAHAGEHSLETQLPFLQRIFNNISIIPLLTGKIHHGQVARLISPIVDDPGTLTVVSSDLSHYYDYETARKLDKATARSIETLDMDGIKHDGACGRTAIRALMILALQREWNARCIDMRNSGDTSSSRDQVVGYGAFHFYA